MISRRAFVERSLLAAATLFALRKASGVRAAAAAKLNFVVPAYFSPLEKDKWNQLLLTCEDGDVIIVNPADGPYLQAGSDAEIKAYREVIALARQKQSVVLGYVHTYNAYGTPGQKKRSTNELRGEVDEYRKVYGLEDIFLDEMDNRPDSVDDSVKFYKALSDYIRQAGHYVMLNPGVVPDEKYADQAGASSLIVFEDTYKSYRKKTDVDWAWTNNSAKYPPHRFAHLVHTTSKKDWEKALQIARALNVGYLFITNDKLSNPWDTLPPYWNEEASKLHQ